MTWQTGQLVLENFYTLQACYFLRQGGPKYILEGHNFFGQKNSEGHKIFDDQNVGNHKMTIESLFILFKKTDFDTVLACLGGKLYPR